MSGTQTLDMKFNGIHHQVAFYIQYDPVDWSKKLLY